MKLFKVLASLGMASILAIPLCFGSSFTKPSASISDEAYGTNWDGSTTKGASRNALYDVISTLGGGHVAVTVNTSAAYLLSITGQDLRTNTTRTNLWDSAYAYGNHATAGYLTTYTEGDYVYGNSAASNVTNSGIANWNSAYAWGNHAIPGYLTSYTEHDYTFGNSAAVNVTNSGISNWNTAYSYGNHAAIGYLTAYSETDPVYGAAAASNVTNSGITNWNTAYAYGNHASAGYLTAYSETDPVYGAAAASNVTSSGITNWNLAYSWGNHAIPGYLTSYTEGDYVYGNSAASNVTNSGISNWNTAYAYGNHQAAGYLKNIVEDVTPQLGANLDLNSFYIGGLVIGTDVQAYDSDLTDIADRSTAVQYTFGNVVVDDEAYSATGWDGITNVPTKNAVRDKIEALPGGHAAVTLNANADFLLALSTQELTVNTTRTGLWDLAYAYGNHAVAGYLTSYTEGDYVYGNSAASNVTNSGITNWNLAYSWGNHAAVGYIEDESDPVYAASNAANLTLIGYWNSAYAWGNHAAVGYLTTFNELDPDFDASVAANIDALDVGNWDLAVAWGNHAAVGYVKTESDPVYAASNAANLTLISYWNAAYAYGNHAAAGYVEDESDPVYAASNAANLTLIGYWNTAYAYGNHAAQNYYDKDVDTSYNVAISAAGNIASTNVGYALNELDMEKALGTHDHSGVYEPAGVTGFEVTITPAGNIASGNVGYALNELDMEKATVAHAHVGAEISGLDVSDDLNLAAGRSLTMSGDSVEADAELYTDTKCIWIESPVATDDLKSIWFAKSACTLTSVWCESDQTATVSLWVDDGSPAVIDGTNMTCDATPPEDTSLDGDATMASGDRLDLDIYSVASTPTWVSICWTYTKDD